MIKVENLTKKRYAGQPAIRILNFESAEAKSWDF
jgi:hypothetical protein